MTDTLEKLFQGVRGGGSAARLYERLKIAIEQAIADGTVSPGDLLPSERELALLTDMSRVTVRKAIQRLVETGALIQRQGSGTFVAPRIQRMQQSLLQLTSFTEQMRQLGREPRSTWLDRGVYTATSVEQMQLGLSPGDRVSRLNRLRLADDIPMLISYTSISTSILPDPNMVDASLYVVLDQLGNRPARGLHRLSAVNLGAAEAALLAVPEGQAGLLVESISYLDSGKVIERTRSVCRGDVYDFTAEMRTSPAEGTDR